MCDSEVGKVSHHVDTCSLTHSPPPGGVPCRWLSPLQQPPRSYIALATPTSRLLNAQDGPKAKYDPTLDSDVWSE
jgi:hypothetical protein